MRNKGADNGDFVSVILRLIYVSREKNERGELDQDLKKCIIRYYQLTEKNLAVKLKGKPFSI